MAVAENLGSATAADILSGDLSTLLSLAAEVAAIAEAEASAAQRREEYGRRLREYLDTGPPGIVPPEGMVFAKQLGGICLFARARDWRETTWDIKQIETRPNRYFIGDQIERRPTLGGMRDRVIGGCAAGLIRIRGLDPAAAEAHRPYYLLLTPQELGSLIIGSQAKFPAGRRFRPFATAA